MSAIRVRVTLAVCLLVGLAACGGGSVGDSVAGQRSSSVPSFDVMLVKANFTDKCKDPIVVDDTFCQQVTIDGMTGTGTTLTVPTGLNAASTARASAICDQIAIAHFDATTGDDLGYTTIRVLDLKGGEAAVCSVH